MRILVVEDEQKVSALVKRGLTSERYAVDIAADGVEALELAETYPYDLIVLDLMMPRLTGAEILQRVRRKNTFVPVLVLTARDSIDDKVKLFELGADDYLTKPFAFAELLVRVKALLRRGPVNRSSTLHVGELELDRLTQQVKRAEVDDRGDGRGEPRVDAAQAQRRRCHRDARQRAFAEHLSERAIDYPVRNHVQRHSDQNHFA